MKPPALLLTAVVAVPLLLVSTAPSADARSDQATPLNIAGRWQLNQDLSDQPPQAAPTGQPGERGKGGEGGGRRHGDHPPEGGYPGGPGGMGGGGMHRGGMPGGGGPGGRPNPEEMARMRDAMRAALDAPSEIIVTRKEDEVVFTASGTGEVTRILVNGKKMKTTAGGAEHQVKAEYKEEALVVESEFGPMKVIDTWRVSPDGKQLERVTRLEGGRGPEGDRQRQIRRVYDRAE